MQENQGAGESRCGSIETAPANPAEPGARAVQPSSRVPSCGFPVTRFRAAWERTAVSSAGQERASAP